MNSVIKSETLVVDNIKLYRKYIEQENIEKYGNMLKADIEIYKYIKYFNVMPKIIKYKFSQNEFYIDYLYVEAIPWVKIFDYNIVSKVKIMINILRTMSYFHVNNIVHGNLKLSNILVTDNNIYITDFHNASIKEYSFSKGYLSFKTCSPEQLDSLPPTVKSDIYSLGIVFYILMTGNFPFYGTKEDIIAQKQQNKYSLLKDDRINIILKKSINYNLTERYNSTLEFIKDLEMLLELLKKENKYIDNGSQN